MRPSFARVLVEVDATKPLVREVKFQLPNGEMVNQSIVYESEPKVCLKCRKLGHVEGTCETNEGKAKEKQRGRSTSRAVWRIKKRGQSLGEKGNREPLFVTQTRKDNNINLEAEIVDEGRDKVEEKEDAPRPSPSYAQMVDSGNCDPQQSMVPDSQQNKAAEKQVKGKKKEKGKVIVEQEEGSHASSSNRNPNTHDQPLVQEDGLAEKENSNEMLSFGNFCEDMASEDEIANFKEECKKASEKKRKKNKGGKGGRKGNRGSHNNL